ncbi:MAG TPA: DUF507 family protein [Candidatus Limnocylindrales bacterium]|nr:DUF507 family protein [Candidatus Limnocylindrales bacterium]
MERQLSEARVEALSIAIAKALAAAPGVQVLDHGGAVRRIAARLQASVGAEGESLDKAVRARIASLSRSVPEGSREWDVLYRQYSQQLSRRR